MSPQLDASISVLLSNVYLHYVLDLWFDRAIRPRLEGQAYLVRYIDDFVVCFEHQRDAERFQAVLSQRLNKFGLELEPTKTRLIAFGPRAHRDAQQQGRQKPETFYFLGFTHYCTRNRNGAFAVGRKTEKSRLKRTLQRVHSVMRDILHERVEDQARRINQLLQGHYAYFGMAGNYRSLKQVYQVVLRYWRRMLSRRSQKSRVTWDALLRILRRFPLKRPKLSIPHRLAPVRHSVNLWSKSLVREEQPTRLRSWGSASLPITNWSIRVISISHAWCGNNPCSAGM